MSNIAEISQTILYGPDLSPCGVFANCLQAAVASALGVTLAGVPHFGALVAWEPAARLWLRGKCLDWRVSEGIPAGRSIVIGTTTRGTGDHAVVGDGGEVAWDPHPSRAGLVTVKYAYAFERWPGEGPSDCVTCGRPSA
jgi:hypothetical protein